MKIELCVASPEALSCAVKYNFDRIELCQALEHGGITPSIGFQQKALEFFPQTHVLIRCREGNFIYSDAEKDIMLRDIASAVKIGIPGVVIGSLEDDLSIDLAFIQKIRTEFPDLELTFHRAFDDIPKYRNALDDLIRLGVKRILTSGGKASVSEGLRQINSCISRVEGKIEIMIGGGISENNIPKILKRIHPDAIHFSGTVMSMKSSDSLFAAECLQVNEEKIEGILTEIRASKG